MMMTMNRFVSAFIFQYSFFAIFGIVLYMIIYFCSDHYHHVNVSYDGEERPYLMGLVFIVPIFNAVVVIYEMQTIIKIIRDRDKW